MNINTPPALGPPTKAKRSSGNSGSCSHNLFCATTTNTSKLFRIILSIGAVGLLLINTQNHGYDHPLNNNASSLQEISAKTSPNGDDDDTSDRQLRTPKPVVEEEPQLDFAVVGFEKTGTFTYDIIFP
jgi:hypothetical protein